MRESLHYFSQSNCLLPELIGYSRRPLYEALPTAGLFQAASCDNYVDVLITLSFRKLHDTDTEFYFTLAAG